jgi:hypothetical protein
MSFNRRRPDRPDRDRYDRPPRGDAGRDRAYPPRDRPPGDRPHHPPRGDRPYQPRPRFDRPPDEGAMSIRLDPRRLGTLKRLAADAGARPGDLVRQWVEERIDASRAGADGVTLDNRLKELERRIAVLESTGPSGEPSGTAPAAVPGPATADEAAEEEPEAPEASTQATTAEASKRRPRTRVSAAPAGPRIALHDEMIAVLAERGPMTATELAAAVAERGRYTPPRSGKPVDAAMVSQRVSNPTYRARFTRAGGRIGLAE